ncbi:baseplate J/gp47 family protein [uncultured Tyzzerella sp.]|uniref:baseplate J/gp47 family protein n=1 Tax=uncultured Tyzzerella sp. TaxID=2321398 RepID=UPI00294240AA|nr:baseplate J/gp47 family protein [uncultured Tyzzerella sp.]
MYEQMTFNNILKRAMEKVSNDFDKRQGSIIYDALAPICAELAQAYIELDRVLKEGFADTASRHYLIKRAMERGLKPFPATHSVILANLQGNINLKGGERFSTDDEVNFYYIGEKEEEYYKLKCEQIGSEGNISYGDLLPIDNIPNLKTAKIHKIHISGVDEEETETFRKRYFESFRSQAFGGNRADYIEKVRLLNDDEDVVANGGIGGIKVYRVPNGGGTVKVVITNNSYNEPTQDLLDIVQEKIDPIQYTGEGMGIAPIGHFVTIEPVKPITINIETEIDLKPGYQIDDIKGYIEESIENYIQELCKTWEENNSIIIRISHIESNILNILGIEDIRNTKINENMENFILDEYSIPLRGDINVT